MKDIDESKYEWHLLYESIDAAIKAMPEGRIIKRFAGKNMSFCMARHHRKIYAFRETCPHNGNSLLRGGRCTEDGLIECPVHRYKFNPENGRGEGYYLPIYPIKTNENGVFIGIEKINWKFF